MLKELLKTLCALDGVSSREDEVRAFLKDRALAAGARVRVDALGNLICEKKGRRAAPNALMLCAHMDEVGLMVKRCTDEGFLKFDAVGGIDRRVLIGKPVWVGPEKIPGVIGLQAIHLTTKQERERVAKLEDFYIDIGAASREEAERHVSVGDVCTFQPDTLEFGNGLFKAKAIDDRVGCAILCLLMAEDLPMDVTFVFTVQEEVGTRGAFAAAFGVKPEVAMVLEGTTAADLPGVEGHKRVCGVGKGPVISQIDRGTVYDRELFDRLRDLCETNAIPWQTKELIAGGNDAKAVQRSRAGVRVCALSAPVRYLHAPTSVVSLADCENMLKLARLFVASWANQLEGESGR